MKFSELSLIAYGGFAGRTLDLSKSGPAFHLIYGANEAGKSTTLRALTALLYGIARNTPDAHTHAGKDLRVGGRLVGDDGRELQIVRRKGNKNTLLDVEGQPMDESSLLGMLHGVPHSVFETSFGLDHENLRRGGEQLRQGKGDLGESLFEAGVGAKGVHNILETLREEADRLFRPRGQRLINEAVAAHDAARERSKERATRAETWQVQKDELDAARAQSDGLQERRRTLMAEQGRLERARGVMPHLARRAELIARRQALGRVILLPEDAAQVRRDAEHELSAVDLELTRFGERIADLESRLGGLDIPESLAQLNSDIVAGIHKKLGRHIGAAPDLPRRQAQLRVLEQEAKALLRDLGRPVDLDRVDNLRVDRALSAKIHRLANDFSGVEERVRRARQDVARAEVDRQAGLDEQASAGTERAARNAQAIDALEREGAPPVESALVAAREARQGSWETLREAAVSGPVDPSVLDGHEAHTIEADSVADRLRREASRVTQLAALLAERDAIAGSRSAVQAARDALSEGAQDAAGLVAGLSRDVARAEAERDEAERELSAWRQDWTRQIDRLQLPPDSGVPETLAFLEGLTQLFAKVDDVANMRGRIAGIERDADDFARDVHGVVDRHLFGLRDRPVEEAAQELVARYEKAQHDVRDRGRLQAELEEARAQRSAFEARSEAAERDLKGLFVVARVKDVEALREAEERSASARRLDAQLEEVEAVLLDMGEGAGLAELVEQTDSLDADGIRFRLDAIEDELEELTEAYKDVHHRIGTVERGLEEIERGKGAAEAAEEAEAQLGKIRGHVHDFVRVRLAAILLEREIRRYRDANQGPIVQRAGELFHRLTLRHYDRLQVGYDAKDEPVLLCVDREGRQVPVEGLSDGTRDQLYLALRLASLMRYAEHGERMPLVLDDILIHFDDERARAALEVLGEFCATTQVLFFTHHARLSELAREVVSADRLVEHRLASQSSTSDPMVN